MADESFFAVLNVFFTRMYDFFMLSLHKRGLKDTLYGEPWAENLPQSIA